MIGKIIFFISISAAIIIVLLLSFISPTPQKKPNKNYSAPWITLTLFLHPLCSRSSELKALKESSSAVIFHHKLTDSVQNKPRVIGKVEGFAALVPVEEYSAFADFNIVYLTLNSPEYSGSLSLEVKASENGNKEEIAVVGGTGDFAFASGVAVWGEIRYVLSNVDNVFYIKLRIRFVGKKFG